MTGYWEGKKNHKYDDIIDLPHHTSEKYPRMDGEARAAQFSPFAALTGHEEVLEETERNVELMMEKIVTGESVEEV